MRYRYTSVIVIVNALLNEGSMSHSPGVAKAITV